MCWRAGALLQTQNGQIKAIHRLAHDAISTRDPVIGHLDPTSTRIEEEEKGFLRPHQLINDFLSVALFLTSRAVS